jgi:hypothetical protein
MAVTDIKALRILPPLAIARFGSSPDPMDNYEALADPADPTLARVLRPAETLRVDPATGEITAAETPPAPPRFRDGDGNIRPVAPFLEVWAQFETDGPFRQLTLADLSDLGLSPESVAWHVRVANRKVVRRTKDSGDAVTADTGPFSDHNVHPLNGQAGNFLDGKTIPLGAVRYLRPTAAFPEVVLRFTPAAGKVYGPGGGDPRIIPVYDRGKGSWAGFQEPDTDRERTVPIQTFANENNVSRGFLDDSCDGTVAVTVTLGVNKTRRAHAHVSVGPPDFAPDTFLVRTLADDLDQMRFGIEPSAPVEAEAVIGIVRRALETMRLMNTEFWNVRYAESAFSEMEAKYAFARSRHKDVLQALQGLKPGSGDEARRAAVATVEFILTVLRRYTQVGDRSVQGRRQMPAMMRGADAQNLALTRRQIRILERAVENLAPAPLQGGAVTAEGAEKAMLDMIASLKNNAIRHFKFDIGGGKHLSDLFQDPPALLNYLRTESVRGSIVPALKDKPLVVPGKPDESAFVGLLSTPAHPMQLPFSQKDPATGKPRIDVVRDWIRSLT